MTIYIMNPSQQIQFCCGSKASWSVTLTFSALTLSSSPDTSGSGEGGKDPWPPSGPVKASQKRMATMCRCKFRKSCAPLDKFLDPLVLSSVSSSYELNTFSSSNPPGYVESNRHICDGRGGRWVVAAATCVNLWLLLKIKCTRAPTERHSSPVEMVLVEE